MFTNENLPLLAAEIAKVDQLLGQLSPGAITSRLSLQTRKKVLEDKLKSLADQPQTNAFIELLFMGGPVLESLAIDASFAAEAVWDFQDILKNETAVRKGGLGSRGDVAKAVADDSRFYITGVATGSFGFTLEENITRGSIFPSLLSEVVTEVTAKMIKFCDATDDEYDLFIQGINKRVFSSFTKFFKLLHDSNAQMKVIGRREGTMFSGDSIERAFVRTETTIVIDHERRMTGRLTGLAATDGIFDFLSNNGIAFSGKLVPTFSAEYRDQVGRLEFAFQIGGIYSAHIVRRTTKRGAAAPHEVYFLVSLSNADNPLNPDTATWELIS
jgi:hypothetical protein